MSDNESQSTDLFEDRKKAAEAKFRQEQAIAFKAAARRAKLLGLWAAQKMGADDPAAYAADIVGVATVGSEAAMQKKIADDLAAKGIALSSGELERKMESLLVEARQQIIDDINSAKLPLS